MIVPSSNAAVLPFVWYDEEVMLEEDDKYVVVFPKIPRKSTRKGQSFTKEILELVPDRTVGTKKMTL